MKKILLFLFVALSAVTLSAQNEPRRIENLDFRWKFHLGDIPNGEGINIDDTNWRTVDVPHDFQIEQPWVEPVTGENVNGKD